MTGRADREGSNEPDPNGLIGKRRVELTSIAYTELQARVLEPLKIYGVEAHAKPAKVIGVVGEWADSSGSVGYGATKAVIPRRTRNQHEGFIEDGSHHFDPWLLDEDGTCVSCKFP
ncbi:hypothetical protein TNCV_2764191 [Trichonephila clavipes]|nr:hypothetical protein TNCV_2764191 [Trichonephila clavipes]